MCEAGFLCCRQPVLVDWLSALSWSTINKMSTKWSCKMGCGSLLELISGYRGSSLTTIPDEKDVAPWFKVIRPAPQNLIVIFCRWTYTLLDYSAAGRLVMRISVSVHKHTTETTCPILISLPVTCGRGSILLQWRSDSLCIDTCSCMDDVTFVLCT